MKIAAVPNWALLTLLISLLSCSGLSSQSHTDLHAITEVSDLPYYPGSDADADKHKLDLYLPKDLDTFPTLLWIHGGAWIVGGRKQEAELARRFAERGIGMVVISYRLSPGTWMDPKLKTGIQHPEHIRDCVRALKWTIEQGGKYGIDPQHIIVGGYSAGAQLSALMAADTSYLAEAGLTKQSMMGALPVAGAYDMVAYYQDHLRESGKEMADGHVLGVFGDLENTKLASPTEYLAATTLPMLVVSETDTYAYTQVYEQAAIAAGKNQIEFLHDRERTHQTLFFALSDPEPCDTREEIIAYIKRLAGIAP